jgi:glycosyltransferase involved in cell wall biosynthesis
MPESSSSHLVLIPSYNTGAKLEQTVRAALAAWNPVWVVLDGSTDDSLRTLDTLLTEFQDALHVIRLPVNQGKGSAILAGLRQVVSAGYTHILTMDADGQHDPNSIRPFMEASQNQASALVLGSPQFDASAPRERLIGRRIANFFANLETLGGNIGDCLFGFRVYPAAALLGVLESTRWARRFDFDPESAVRLVWRGHRVINLPTACRYFKSSEGGVSHFNYLRDNLLLIWMYARLLIGFLFRLPLLILHRLTAK